MTESGNERDTLLARAQELYESGSHAQAAECYERLLEHERGNALLWFNLAVARHLQGDLGLAETAYRETLERDPLSLDARLNLGTLLQATDRGEEAVRIYRGALAANPGAARLLNNLGNALYGLHRFDEAVEAYDAALSHRSGYAEAWNNRGVALKALDRLEEAAQSFVAALQRKADYAEAWANLGNTRKAAGDPGGAIECYRQALALQPQDAQTYSNLGNALQQLGMPAEALEFYKVALKLNSELVTARWNRGLVRLQLGDYAQGWRDYESGFDVGERPRRHLAIPRWSGQPLDGRRLLVHAEQGFGDTLQFVRYLPQLRAQGATVLLECPPALHRLLAHAGLADELIVRQDGVESVVACDYQMPLLSLPGAMTTTLDSIPAGVPYLRVDQAWGEPWGVQLAALPRYRVGLCWSGNPQARNNRDRSISLSALAPLAMAGVELVCLQMGAAADEPAPAGVIVHRLAPAFEDFAATAAVIAQLDLIVTVDTALAHLAGGLGIPAWVLLSHAADWRWLCDRADSPWYPSLRLFRQPARGDWQSVVDGVATALRERLRLGTNERHLP